MGEKSEDFSGKTKNIRLFHRVCVWVFVCVGVTTAGLLALFNLDVTLIIS